MSEYGVNIQPVAWVIPGDDNARPDGFIDAMAWEEGEFTKPLYAHPAALDKPEAVEGVWQPIATAPKDRTKVLLWNEAWLHPVMGYWSPTINAWLEFGSRDAKANAATHWMPIPEPPK